MQELPPRDRISLFKGQCELLSNNLFSASRLTRGPQSLLGPQPGDMGRRESHKARSIVNWSPSLLLWSLAFLLCQNLLLTSASWYHPPFPEATENLGWMFFSLRGTQVCQYWSGPYQWQTEGRAWHLSSIARSGVSFGSSGDSAPVSCRIEKFPDSIAWFYWWLRMRGPIFA